MKKRGLVPVEQNQACRCRRRDRPSQCAPDRSGRTGNQDAAPGDDLAGKRKGKTDLRSLQQLDPGLGHEASPIDVFADRPPTELIRLSRRTWTSRIPSARFGSVSRVSVTK